MLFFSFTAAIVGILTPVASGAQLPPPPATAKAIPFTWTCEIRDPGGKISKLSGRFEANPINPKGYGDTYLRAPAHVTEDDTGRFLQADYVYKYYSVRGMDGEYRLSVGGMGESSSLVFNFHGFDDAGTVVVNEDKAKLLESSNEKAVGVGFCRQFPVNVKR